jgi:hypothetical protein
METMKLAQTVTVQPGIQIGKIILDALVFNFRKSRENTVNGDNLLGTVARLFILLEERQVEYVLVGGIAVLQYVEGRNTEDIDLIMALQDLKKLPEIEIKSQEMYFARGKFEELSIDLLLTTNPLFEKVRREYTIPQRFVEQDSPCATVEGLLLLKLYALPSLYRQGDFSRVGIYENDIATLMQAYQPELDPLFVELARHMSATDLKAVREVVTEIQGRIERFGRGFGKNE